MLFHPGGKVAVRENPVRSPWSRAGAAAAGSLGAGWVRAARDAGSRSDASPYVMPGAGALTGGSLLVAVSTTVCLSAVARPRPPGSPLVIPSGASSGGAVSKPHVVDDEEH